MSLILLSSWTWKVKWTPKQPVSEDKPAEVVLPGMSLSDLEKFDLSTSVINPDTIEEMLDSVNIVKKQKPQRFALPEPLGFKGKDYQRLFIHYDTIFRTSPNVYSVKGKTLFRDTVRLFTGTIQIDSLSSARITSSEEDEGYYGKLIDEYGHAYASYRFVEDALQSGNGIYTGRARFDFVLKRGRLYYDTVWLRADGYFNNQYEGTWSSSDGKLRLKCNWGDFRIPDSGDLDYGTQEFAPRKKYFSRGWQLFHELHSVQTWWE